MSYQAVCCPIHSTKSGGSPSVYSNRAHCAGKRAWQGGPEGSLPVFLLLPVFLFLLAGVCVCMYARDCEIERGQNSEREWASDREADILYITSVIPILSLIFFTRGATPCSSVPAAKILGPLSYVPTYAPHACCLLRYMTVCSNRSTRKHLKGAQALRKASVARLFRHRLRHRLRLRHTTGDIDVASYISTWALGIGSYDIRRLGMPAKKRLKLSF